MSKIFPIVLVLIYLLSNSSCITTKKSTNSQSENIETVFLLQNGQQTIINEDIATIAIKRDSFSLLFFSKPYNPDTKEFNCVQVAAFLDQGELSKFETGMLLSDTKCFAPATGMAAYNGGYRYLIFTNDAHHYLFYENADKRRLNLVRTANDHLLLEFEINNLWLNKSNSSNKDKVITTMSATDLDEFYLAVLNDRNQNDTIDKGELKKLTIKIK